MLSAGFHASTQPTRSAIGAVDPPPDLAIEVDVTSKTQLIAYEALGVPELWQFSQGSLRINILQGGEYVESAVQTFHGILNYRFEAGGRGQEAGGRSKNDTISFNFKLLPSEDVWKYGEARLFIPHIPQTLLVAY